ICARSRVASTICPSACRYSESKRVDLIAVASTRQQHPIVQIKNHCWVVVVAGGQRKISARTILGCNRAYPRGADVLASCQLGGRQAFGPCEYRPPPEQRRNETPGVDRRDMEGIAQAIEG